MSSFEACLSHNSDNWRTPSKLYDYFINTLGCIDTFEYCSESDQYEKMYQNSLIFMNPPFSHLRTKKFYDYVYKLLVNDNIIFLLCPARTDTNWFYNLFDYITDLYFIKGRLHFNDSRKVAPFPTMILKLHYTGNILFSLHFKSCCNVLSIEDFISLGCK